MSRPEDPFLDHNDINNVYINGIEHRQEHEEEEQELLSSFSVETRKQRKHRKEKFKNNWNELHVLPC